MKSRILQKQNKMRLLRQLSRCRAAGAPPAHHRVTRAANRRGEFSALAAAFDLRGTGTLCGPAAIAVDPLSSVVYVGDACTFPTPFSAVRTVTPAGLVGTLAGGGGLAAANPCPNGDGTGPAATFWGITAMESAIMTSAVESPAR